MSKEVECKLNYLHDFTGDENDLNSEKHKGFTIGNGKTLYWYIVWNKYGNATVFKGGQLHPKGRFIKGDSKVTIHFK